MRRIHIALVSTIIGGAALLNRTHSAPPKAEERLVPRGKPALLEATSRNAIAVNNPSPTAAPRETLQTAPSPATSESPDERQVNQRSAMDEAPQVEAEEHAIRLESAFEGEKPDAHWTAAVSVLFSNRVLPHLGAGSKMLSIECRKSMCRLMSAHADPESYQSFVRTAFRDQTTQLWNGSGFAMATPDRDPDGRRIAVAYLAREGDALPDIGVD